MTPDKTCFFVSQIGRSDSKERKQADYIFDLLLPTLKKKGYDPDRADKIPRPGSITQQIIDRIFNADLVVIDLSNKNPNVFYELAIRHATNKPFIQIIDEKEINTLPFDVHNQRTLGYSYSGDEAEDDKLNKSFIDSFEDYMKNCELNPQSIKNPIAAENSTLSFLKNDDKPVEKTIAEIISLLTDKLKASLPNQTQPPQFTPNSFLAFNKTNTDILNSIQVILEKSTHGIISCSGPLIFTTFQNFIKYTQLSFVAVSVNDLDYWMRPEGKEYLEITTDHKKKNRDVALERIFVIGKHHKLNESHFKQIFLYQLKHNYKIAFVIDETLKNITDNILKLDFGLFDQYAVSFFRLENDRFFEIDTTKETCKKYHDYYEQIKRKCIRYDDTDEVLISKEDDLDKMKKVLAAKKLFDKNSSSKKKISQPTQKR